MPKHKSTRYDPKKRKQKYKPTRRQKSGPLRVNYGFVPLGKSSEQTVAFHALGNGPIEGSQYVVSAVDDFDGTIVDKEDPRKLYRIMIDFNTMHGFMKCHVFQNGAISNPKQRIELSTFPTIVPSIVFYIAPPGLSTWSIDIETYNILVSAYVRKVASLLRTPTSRELLVSSDKSRRIFMSIVNKQLSVADDTEVTTQGFRTSLHELQVEMDRLDKQRQMRSVAKKRRTLEDRLHEKERELQVFVKSQQFSYFSVYYPKGHPMPNKHFEVDASDYNNALGSSDWMFIVIGNFDIDAIVERILHNMQGISDVLIDQVRQSVERIMTRYTPNVNVLELEALKQDYTLQLQGKPGILKPLSNGELKDDTKITFTTMDYQQWLSILGADFSVSADFTCNSLLDESKNDYINVTGVDHKNVLSSARESLSAIARPFYKRADSGKLVLGDPLGFDDSMSSQSSPESQS